MKIPATQKTKLFIKHFLSKCDQIHKKTADSITFTKEIFNGNLHFDLLPSAFYTARQSVNATKDNENSQNVAL